MTYVSCSTSQIQLHLRQLFNISDSTINTGVFRPKGSNSIWLFVTEEKGVGITPYYDKLEGGVLQWQGQLSGRTDQLIINHEHTGYVIGFPPP